MNTSPLPDLKLPDARPPDPALHWVHVAVGNLDSVPDELLPPDNCPECSAAWVEYVAVGYRIPKHLSWHGTFYEAHWCVHAKATPYERVVAVRLRCAGDGHYYEFDGETLSPFVVPWSAVVGGGALVAMMGALVYAVIGSHAR